MMHPEFPQGRLLLITNDYIPQTGGVAWYYYSLVNKLGRFESLRESDIEVLNLGRWTMTWRWPFLIVPLIWHTVRRKPDYWWVGQVLPVGTIVWLLSCIWRKPYLVSTHGMDIMVPLRARRKLWLVRNILQRATLITANSEWTKRKIIEHYFQSPKSIVKSKNIIVIHPEPKPKREVRREAVSALRLKFGIPNDAKVLLTVSRLMRRKGIDRVLNALPEAWKILPEVHYMVVGDGEERKKLEETLGALDKISVHFAGKTSDEELAVYYTMADAFILLPRDIDGDMEGFGIVYLEADQYGLPIIGTHSGGTMEALNQCKDVTLVNDPDDTREIARAICQLFQ